MIWKWATEDNEKLFRWVRRRLAKKVEKKMQEIRKGPRHQGKEQIAKPEMNTWSDPSGSKKPPASEHPTRVTKNEITRKQA